MRQSKFESGGGDMGNYILRSGLERRRFLRTAQAKGHTTFRVIPSFGPDGPSPQIRAMDYVPDASPGAILSDAFCELETCAFFGEQKLHLVSEVVDAPEGCGKSPATTFFSAIDKYRKDNPRECPQSWHDWCSRKHGPPVLSKPSRNLFMQGILFEHQGKPIIDRKTGKPTMMYPTVLQLAPATARNSLISGLTLRRGTEQLATSPAETLLGDIVDLNSGNVIKVIPSAAWNEQLQREQTKYEVAVAGAYPVPEKVAREIWMPWNDLIYFPTCAWLIDRIAESFSADAVVFALEGTPYASHISDTVRRAARSVPGTRTVGIGISAGEMPVVAPVSAPVMPAPAVPVFAAPAALPAFGGSMPAFDPGDDDDELPGLPAGPQFPAQRQTRPSMPSMDQPPLVAMDEALARAGTISYSRPGKGPEDVQIDPSDMRAQMAGKLDEAQRVLQSMGLPRIS